MRDLDRTKFLAPVRFGCSRYSFYAPQKIQKKILQIVIVLCSATQYTFVTAARCDGVV